MGAWSSPFNEFACINDRDQFYGLRQLKFLNVADSTGTARDGVAHELGESGEPGKRANCNHPNSALVMDVASILPWERQPHRFVGDTFARGTVNGRETPRTFGAKNPEAPLVARTVSGEQRLLPRRANSPSGEFGGHGIIRTLNAGLMSKSRGNLKTKRRSPPVTELATACSPKFVSCSSISNPIEPKPEGRTPLQLLG